MNIAVPAQAVKMWRRIIERDARNSTGKRRRSTVVKIAKNCWMLNIIRITKHATKVPIVRPEFQAHVVPPNVRAMTKDVYKPAFKRAPIQSNVFIFVRVGTPGLGWKVGMSIKAGAITPKIIRLI
jgi:hypothetical protein